MNNGNTSVRSVFNKGLIGGAGSQVISIFIGLISVPIGLNYFGALQYGVWLTISSLLAYIGLSTLGTGTAAVALMANESSNKLQEVIFWRSIKLLSCISVMLLLLVFLAIQFQNSWSVLLGDVPDFVRHEAVTVLAITVIFFILRLPTLAFSSAFLGLQEVHLERFYVILLPLVLSFIALLLTVFFSGDLILFSVLTGCAQLISGWVGGLHFLWRHPNMRKYKSSLKESEYPTSDLLSSGSRFFFIGLAAMLVWHTDNIVISYFLGPESVTAYAITFKLFTAAFSIFILVGSVLMPMVGKAASKNDWAWLGMVYQHASSIMATLGGLVWVGGVVMAKPIILLWAGESGYAGMLTVFALGGYGYILSTVNLNANYLSGLNATRTMLWIGWAEAIVNLLLSIAFVHLWGIGGVALGTFASAFLTVYWLLPQDISRQTQLKLKIDWKPNGKHFFFVVLPALLGGCLISFYTKGLYSFIAGLILCLIYLILSWKISTDLTQKFIIQALPLRLVNLFKRAI